MYAALAALVTWPLAVSLGAVVPGAERSDLWNSLWGLWYVEASLADGVLPWWTQLLGHPDGGVIWPADPLNALLALPLVALVGVPVAWGVLVLAHLTASGLAAHALSLELGAGRGAWVAGVGWALAPVMVSALQNGSSEMVGGVWLPLAVLGLVRIRRGGSWVLAGLGLALAAVSAWYTGVAAGLFWAALLLLERRRGLWMAGGLALVLVMPVAALSHQAATTQDNLIGIKGDKELTVVRRTIGPADWRGWFVPGSFRSPDFARSSRYGEQFIHCHYLGWVLIGAGLLALRRRRGESFLLLAGGTGLVAAMGPVVVMDGEPLVFGDYAIALPWLVVERLPGLSSLSLLYRLAAAPSLALALLAAQGVGRWGPLWALAVALELRLLSPVAGLPGLAEVGDDQALTWLRGAPEGAVMNFPVAGGRRYLYEQTVHQKPIAGSLNFPNNGASMRVWSALLKEEEDLLAEAGRAGRREGLRYLVVHEDPVARPDQHDEAVRRLSEAMEPAARGPGVEVYALW